VIFIHILASFIKCAVVYFSYIIGIDACLNQGFLAISMKYQEFVTKCNNSPLIILKKRKFSETCVFVALTKNHETVTFQ